MLRRTVIAGALVLAGCASPDTGGGPNAPSGETNPRGLLTGTLFERTVDGVRPLAGGLLMITELGGGYSPMAHTDGTGLYVQDGFPLGATMLVYVAGTGRILGEFHQPCVASVVITSETVLDVYVNRLAVPALDTSPRVSGVVYSRTPGGRQPVPGKKVLFRSQGTLGAYTWTDANGGFTFCAVPPGAGSIDVEVGPEVNWDYGSAVESHAIVVTGDTIIDVEIGR